MSHEKIHEKIHEHTEYAYVDGLFTCLCGAVRSRPGEWMNSAASAAARDAAAKESQRLMEKHGTTVDGYGHRLES